MKSNILKKIEKLTDMLAASAFAELGEFDSAREIAGKYPGYEVRHSGAWEKEQTAISFAEAGDFDTARDVIRGHEEHPIRPDECQYGDNDLCYSQA